MRSSLLIIVSLFIAGSASVPAAAEEIHAPAEPPRVETWQLREVWRLDDEADETLPLMGVISQAVVEDDGTILLLDSQMGHVLVVSPDGEFLGTLGRQGQGPGELENPNTIFLADDGTVGLVQAFPGRIVQLNRDGTPGGSIMAEGLNEQFSRVREVAGNLVIAGQRNEYGTGEGNTSAKYLARHTREGERTLVYFESRTVSSYDPPVMTEVGSWFPARTWDLAPDGALVVAPERDLYEIRRLDPDGAVRDVITRDFTPHRRTSEERQEVLGSMRMWGRGGELKPKKTILDTEPVIEGLMVMEDGRVWVRNCHAERDLPDGVYCRYDVFGADGRLEAEVHLAVPVNPRTDYFAPLPDGRFLWYRNARSALAAVFANIEGGEDLEEEVEEDDEGPMGMQVVLLERTP